MSYEEFLEKLKAAVEEARREGVHFVYVSVAGESRLNEEIVTALHGECIANEHDAVG